MTSSDSLFSGEDQDEPDAQVSELLHSQTRKSHLDLVLMALTGEVDSIRKLSPRPSRYCLAKACVVLRERQHEQLAEKIVSIANRLYPRLPTKRAPSKGDSRPYSVLLQDDILCVRIPIALLRLKKCDKARAWFGVLDKDVIKSGRFILLAADPKPTDKESE